MSNKQLPLAVNLSDQSQFENFYVPDNNLAVLHSLRELAAGLGESSAFLFGAKGTGKTHLLQAMCQLDKESLYFPLAELGEFEPAEIFEGLPADCLVCLDDIDLVLGNAAWDEALFHLFNRVHQQGGRWVASASQAVFELNCLPDLRSRLAWGLVHQLRSLNEQQCIEMLQFRAQHRGLELPEEVARYMMNRVERSTTVLMAILGKLDTAALQAQRRLTIPFVREVLERDG